MLRKGFSVLGCAAVLLTSTVFAQNYPTKPIKIIVPYAPGGATDMAARPYAQKLQAAMGQSVIVENRPGVGAVIGMNAVANSPPDGYTMGLASFSFPLGHLLPQKTPFHPIKDFTGLSLLGKSPSIIVSHPGAPFRSIKELVAYAKSRPGQVNYGMVGLVATGSMAALSLQIMTGIKMTPIPYKGAGPSMTAVAAGEVHLNFTSIVPAVPLVKSGKVIALAVTGAKRAAVLPDVPTVAESGVAGYEEGGFYGLVMPAKTPPAIVSLLHKETVQIVATEDIRKVYASAGFDAMSSSSPQEFTKFLADQATKWGEVFKKYPLPSSLK